LRDTTRLADSDARLWSEIFLQNREAVLQALQDFSSQLERLRTAILKSDVDEIGTIFNQGKQGRSRVSGKHGSMPRDYVHLMIVIKDEPGALKQLFEECAVVNANIEDLSIEHSPKQETGLITLAFSPEEASRVQEHLVARHWKVHAR
jgi:prephenate dehydrogenase